MGPHIRWARLGTSRLLVTVGDNALTSTATGGGCLNYFTLDTSEPALRQGFALLLQKTSSQMRTRSFLTHSQFPVGREISCFCEICRFVIAYLGPSYYSSITSTFLLLLLLLLFYHHYHYQSI